MNGEILIDVNIFDVSVCFVFNAKRLAQRGYRGLR
jgi:hypothetical protein